MKGYVKKDTIEDLDDVRKNVVDDIKTAIEKKNDIIKALGNRYTISVLSNIYLIIRALSIHLLGKRVPAQHNFATYNYENVGCLAATMYIGTGYKEVPQGPPAPVTEGLSSGGREIVKGLRSQTKLSRFLRKVQKTILALTEGCGHVGFKSQKEVKRWLTFTDKCGGYVCKISPY